MNVTATRKTHRVVNGLIAHQWSDVVHTDQFHTDGPALPGSSIRGVDGPAAANRRSSSRLSQLSVDPADFCLHTWQRDIIV